MFSGDIKETSGMKWVKQWEHFSGRWGNNVLNFFHILLKYWKGLGYSGINFARSDLLTSHLLSWAGSSRKEM